jgi:tRNA nucleotidyltransferase (CCA-adding enzyme)
MLEVVKKVVSEVYQVGGSVRDEVLGKTPKDYDFATPLSPDEIEAKIRAAHKKPYLIGKKFGTVGMKIDGQFIEITTFRKETYEKGNRKPDVEFVTDLKEDLSRRDFTINAMAKGDDLYDPFGGRLDILERVIKCVGIPKHRFKEDPLRILRAARFASQLGFEIEHLTESTMKRMAPSILNVSKERWVLELDKILQTDKPSIGLDILMRNRLFNFMIPELSLQLGYDQNSDYHTLTLWEHTKRVVDGVPNDLDLRWAALFHDIAKPFVPTPNSKGRSKYLEHDRLGYELVIQIAHHLKWPNNRTKAVSDLVRWHLKENSPLKPADNSAK